MTGYPLSNDRLMVWWKSGAQSSVGKSYAYWSARFGNSLKRTWTLRTFYWSDRLINGKIRHWTESKQKKLPLPEQSWVRNRLRYDRSASMENVLTLSTSSIGPWINFIKPNIMFNFDLSKISFARIIWSVAMIFKKPTEIKHRLQSHGFWVLRLNACRKTWRRTWACLACRNWR